MDEFVEVAKRLGSQAARQLPFTPEFEPLGPNHRPAPCVAVDGSNAILVDNGALWVVAYRAAALRWPSPPIPEIGPKIAAASPAEAQQLIETKFARLGIEPPRIASADIFGQCLRELAEFEATIQTIPNMEPGMLLLVDGALSRLPRGPQAFADRIMATASRHGVRVMGVAKRSGLDAGGVPLVPALADSGPKSTWCVRVPGHDGTYIARLHAKSRAVFRIDAARREDLELLLPLSRDAVYTGYPYPLAVAHNAVALTAGKVEELKARLDRAIRVGGGTAAGVVSDFHAVLDRNVPG